MTINVAQLSIHEILKTVDESDDKLNKLIGMIKSRPYLKGYLSSMVSDKWITIDPVTVKWKDYGYHQSQAGMYMLSKPAYNVFTAILMGDVNNHSKVLQLTTVLEMLHSDESNVMLGILTKDLSKLFPNITHELICEAIGVDENE